MRPASDADEVVSQVASERPTRRVSVIICAYTVDRWEDLQAAIRSARAQTLPPYEVIVVIDHSLDLLARVTEAGLPIKAVENREARGLSGARNTGVAEAGGEILAFLDDDAIATQDWLERLTSGYEDANIYATGGAIEPVWSKRRPGFPHEFNWVVGCTYKGMPTERTFVRNVIGANMSFRRDVVIRSGGFHHGVGRIGATPVGCEETELCIRVSQRWTAGRVLYEPDALVFHGVPEERSGWRYFMARCYSEGLSKARLCRFNGAGDGLSSERDYVLRTLPGGFVKALHDTLAGRDGGFERATRILGGLVVTSAGFLRGSVSMMNRKVRHA